MPRFQYLVTSILVVILTSGSLFAQGVFQSQTSGPWQAAGTWTLMSGTDADGIPDSDDNVTILAAHTVDVNAASASFNLTITGVLNFPTNSIILAVGGNLTMTGSSQVTGNNNNRILNVSGTLTVPFGQTASIGGIQMNVTGATNISGYFQFALSGTGNKTFNGTITVNGGGTWDNLVGEDPYINCSIVNNGNWPPPTGGTGVYRVNSSGASYTYGGSSQINMSELRLTAAGTGTVTNQGTLVLSGTGGSGNLLNVGAGRVFNNGDGVANAVLNLTSANLITNSGGTIDFTKSLNTVNYASSGAQTVFATTYYNLSTSNAGLKSLAGNVTTTNQVSISGSSILNASTNTLDGAANLVMAGTGELRFSKTGTTLPELTGTTNSLATGTSITFNGAGSQTAKASSAANPSTTNTYPYQNFNVSGNNASSLVDMTNVTLISGNLALTNLGRITNNPVMTVVGTFNFGPSATTILSNNIVVGDIVFSSGTLNYSNRNITINGNSGAWTNNGGVAFVNTSSTVTFTTGTSQKIKGTTSTVFTNLVINNSNGVSLSTVDIQVGGVLTLTAGNLITSTRSVYVTGSVSRTSGFVEGNLQKDVTSGSPSPTFEVGTGTSYSPVSMTFTGVSVSGTITCSSTALDHPFINSSNIEPNKSVNRYWTISNTGLSYTSYSSTFNFIAGDVDGLATPSNFITKWTTAGITWSTTTVGTRTATSTQFITEPSSSLASGATVSYQIGEQIVTTGIFNRVTGTSNSWNNKATWIQNRTGNVTFNGTVNVVGSGTLFLTELVAGAGGDFIMLQTSAGTIQGQVQSITDDTHLTLFSVSAGSASGGYGRQYVPSAIGDAVTIGNSNIANATTTIQYDMPAATLINSLTLNTASTPLSTAQSLTHTATNLLTIQTNVTINQPGGTVTDLWDIAAGQASVLGTLSVGSGINAANQIAQVNLSTGTLSAGNIYFNASNNNGVEAATVINVTGAGTINLSGAMTFANNRGLLTPGTTSTFNFNGTSPAGQLLVFPSANTVTFKYNNITFNNTTTNGVLVSPPGQNLTATNVTGNVSVQTGSFVTSDNTAITGAASKTFTVNPGATFRMTGANSSFPTGFSGGFSLGTTGAFGTVSYEQTNNLNVTAQSYGHLKLLSTGSSGASFALPTGITVAGNLTIGDGTSNVTITQTGGGGSTLAVTGDIIINSSATLNATGGNRIRSITVGGNWTNNGTFSPSTNAADAGVTFNGTGPSQPQIIGGATADVFFRVVINTALASNLVRLSKGISFTSSGNARLTLTQGGLDLNGNTLTLLSNATTAISGGAIGAYIKSENTSAPFGTISWAIGTNTGSYVFPFGKSQTEYIPFTFNVTVAGAPAASSIAVSTYATATNNTPYPPTVTNLTGTSGGNSVVDRFWIIAPTGYATNKPTVTMTFTAVGTDAIPPSEKPGSVAAINSVVTSPAGIAAQRWNPSNYWDAALPSQTFANNAPSAGFFQVTVPGVTNFSPWTLADVNTPLPVTLRNFTAVAQTDRVNINWNTESEVNNALFTVQKTMDGEDYKDVAEVAGAGTTAQAKSYSAVDYRPAAGKWYYRLKQTDLDGTFTYSKLVLVDISSSLSWTIFPNPSDGKNFNIQFSEVDLGKTAYVRIQDISGRELLLSSETLKSSNLTVEMNQNMAPGLYIISVSIGQEMVRQKLVVK